MSLHRLSMLSRHGLGAALAAFSPFDADAFLSTTVDGPMSTAPLNCDEGEYKAIIDDGEKAIAFRSFPGKNGKPDSHQCVIQFSILDDAQKARMQREKVLVPMTCWLDLNKEETGLDLSDGKNVALGRLRKAVGQNDGAWNPAMLKGKGPLMVKVTHRSNPETGDKYHEVSRVAPLS